MDQVETEKKDDVKDSWDQEQEDDDGVKDTWDAESSGEDEDEEGIEYTISRKMITFH